MTPDDLVITAQGCRFRGRQLPCAIGRGGITRNKREGDGATPAGAHAPCAVLYRADRVARATLPAWARPIGPRDLWADDPAHPDYNRPVRAPFAASAERLARADPLYDIVVTTDWNSHDPQPGRGSAIFIHVWRGPRVPTAGCVAFRRDHLLWIIARLTRRTRLLVRAPG